MKLHEVPRESYIQITGTKIDVPVDSIKPKKGDILFFDHIDGMYSLCVSPQKEFIHLGASTSVKIVTEKQFNKLKD